MRSLVRRPPRRTKALDYDKDKHLIFLYNYPLQVQKAVQEIQGVAGMIVYDGEVSEEEVVFLSQWLQQHEGLMTKYPLKELKTVFTDISEDGIVTPAERKKLFEFLSNIATGQKQIRWLMEYSPSSRRLPSRNGLLFLPEKWSSVHAKEQRQK